MYSCKATAAFTLLHFSLNTLTLFGLALAIGLVVDDAIVVVEAVERHIEDDKVDAKEAAKRAMAEVSSLVITIVLGARCCVYPNSFPGRDLVCALLLKPASEHRSLIERAFGCFNHTLDFTIKIYESIVSFLIRWKIIVFAGLLLIAAGMYMLFKLVPSSLVPSEDQGYFMVNIELPSAAALGRTEAVSAQVEKILKSIPDVQYVSSIGGFSILGGSSDSNVASMFVTLKPWSQRTSADTQIGAILTNAQSQFNAIPTAEITGFNPPPIPGLGETGGFQFELESQTGSTNINALSKTANQVVAEAKKIPALAGSFTTFRANVPQISLEVDRAEVLTLGISLSICSRL